MTLAELKKLARSRRCSLDSWKWYTVGADPSGRTYEIRRNRETIVHLFVPDGDDGFADQHARAFLAAGLATMRGEKP